MSVTQILEESKTFSVPELESLEQSFRLERLRRTRNVLSVEETRLFEVINEPLPGGQRLPELRAKRDAHALLPDELDELIRLDDERERVWARKLRAVADLADGRGEEFDALYRQLELHLRTEAGA